MNIAINGFGRIGRAVLKIALENKINVVAINDIHGVEDAAYLLKHDSIYGHYPRQVSYKGAVLQIGGGTFGAKRSIRVLTEKDPTQLPWKELKVDIVVESTGIFHDREKAMLHLQAGAKKVIITSPADNPDITIVPGVNSKMLKKEHQIISVASCTTNCLAPTIKVLHEAFGLESAYITTVHAYTNDQSLHDEFHTKRRRGRAAALNLVPTSSGANEAISAVLPELAGKVQGLAVRAPIPCGSLLDVVAVVQNPPLDAAAVNAAFAHAAQKELDGIVHYSDEDLVSSDIIGNPSSAVFDSQLTSVNGHMIKVFAWYDNEFGYSNRVIDVIKMLR